MPRPSKRTRSRKPTRKPLPGGKTGTQFKKEIAARPTCSLCGQELGGLSNNSPKTRDLSRSTKRVSRVYGGQLCHRCLKTALKHAVRVL